MVIRDDLLQHAAVGGQICGLVIMLLVPHGWSLGPAIGLGLLLAGAAALGREAWQWWKRTGTAAPDDAAATYAGALLIAAVAQWAIGG
ncbi:hypothetical protein EV684_101563 [Rubrivivax gelatinosus]|uniref:Uncharacterized protein n=1 Tax=Rubrivivax gelatinosus TaxID=28068 RepID=A0A4R2ME49_RUBGE|nr:hypothetical protein EV684_101563 [Rubrivivax gelatinosus]